MLTFYALAATTYSSEDSYSEDFESSNTSGDTFSQTYTRKPKISAVAHPPVIPPSSATSSGGESVPKESFEDMQERQRLMAMYSEDLVHARQRQRRISAEPPQETREGEPPPAPMFHTNLKDQGKLSHWYLFVENNMAMRDLSALQLLRKP